MRYPYATRVALSLTLPAALLLISPSGHCTSPVDGGTQRPRQYNTRDVLEAQQRWNDRHVQPDRMFPTPRLDEAQRRLMERQVEEPARRRESLRPRPDTIHPNEQPGGGESSTLSPEEIVARSKQARDGSGRPDTIGDNEKLNPQQQAAALSRDEIEAKLQPSRGGSEPDKSWWRSAWERLESLVVPTHSRGRGVQPALTSTQETAPALVGDTQASAAKLGQHVSRIPDGPAQVETTVAGEHEPSDPRRPATTRELQRPARHPDTVGPDTLEPQWEPSDPRRPPSASEAKRAARRPGTVKPDVLAPQWGPTDLHRPPTASEVQRSARHRDTVRPDTFDPHGKLPELAKVLAAAEASAKLRGRCDARGMCIDSGHAFFFQDSQDNVGELAGPANPESPGEAERAGDLPISKDIYGARSGLEGSESVAAPRYGDRQVTWDELNEGEKMCLVEAAAGMDFNDLPASAQDDILQARMNRQSVMGMVGGLELVVAEGIELAVAKAAVGAEGGAARVLLTERGVGISTKAAEAGPTPPEGSFSISDWAAYPAGMPKPAGPLRLLQGEEYAAARQAANQANRAMRQADASLAGKQIHEIQPVKFGGSPIDPANKVPLTPAQHAPVTSWWNRLMRALD